MTALRVKMADPEASHTLRGRMAAPASDPAGAQFVLAKSYMQTSILTMQPMGERIRKHPAPVATPLPPFLNLR